MMLAEAMIQERCFKAKATVEVAKKLVESPFKPKKQLVKKDCALKLKNLLLPRNEQGVIISYITLSADAKTCFEKLKTMIEMPDCPS